MTEPEALPGHAAAFLFMLQGDKDRECNCRLRAGGFKKPSHSSRSHSRCDGDTPCPRGSQCICTAWQ